MRARCDGRGPAGIRSDHLWFVECHREATQSALLPPQDWWDRAPFPRTGSAYGVRYPRARLSGPRCSLFQRCEGYQERQMAYENMEGVPPKRSTALIVCRVRSM